MSDEQKKTDPFRLIVIVVIIGAACLGMYLMTASINSRLTSIEQSMNGNTATLEIIINRLNDKMDAVGEAAAARVDAPVAAPVPVDPAVPAVPGADPVAPASPAAPAAPAAVPVVK